jgi:hypothetical protein
MRGAGAGSVAGLAAPDGQTAYVFLLPAGVTVTRAGETGCGAFGGYHGEAPLAGGGSTPYIVVPRCVMFDGLANESVLTYTLTHELVETVTDPFTATQPAYDGVNSAFLAFDIYLLGEAGDLCPERYGTTPGLPFVVQQTWSNRAAAAGHDPCVPSSGEPYVAAIPVLPDTSTQYGDGDDVPVVHVPVGTSKTIDVHLVSDGPTGAFAVSADDMGVDLGNAEPALTLALDRTSGKNGDVAKLTITATRAGQIRAAKGVAGFVLVARTGSRVTVWPALVTN